MHRPFIRWAGGKQSLVKWLHSFLPERFERYFEPFLGAGALYFYFAPTNSYLSDINQPLVNCYNAIKTNPELVYKYLRSFGNSHSRQFYYRVRDEYNENINTFSCKQASRFIYLVQSSYNGIYRVNLNGAYNVPYGKVLPSLPNRDQLIETCKVLSSSNIQCHSYEKIIEEVRPGDFVYFDPPYPKINGTSNFQHYTKARFPFMEQVRLAEIANSLDRMGVLVLVSNADLPEIRDLFPGWLVQNCEVTRYVSSKSYRHKVSEIIIRNYQK